MTWLSVDYLENRRGLPAVACCYVVYINSELCYIGSTNNLRNRFSGHAFHWGYANNFVTPWGEYCRPFEFSIKYSPSRKYGDWLMREARLIRRIQPAFNKKLKGRAK